MRVELHLFANLAEYLPPGAHGGRVSVDVPEGATVDLLLARLAIPDRMPRLLLVNGQEPGPAQPLVAGDVVSVLPPLVGG